MGVSLDMGVGTSNVTALDEYYGFGGDAVGGSGVEAGPGIIPEDGWILDTGIWNDAKYWDDTAFWDDGP